MMRNGQMKFNVSVTWNTRGTDEGVCPFADALCSPFLMPPPHAKKLSCSLSTPTYNVAHAHAQRCPRPRTTLPTAVDNVAHGRGQRTRSVHEMAARHMK